MGALKRSYIASGKHKRIKPLWKWLGSYLKSWTYTYSVTIQQFLSQKKGTNGHSKIYTKMFEGALFITAQTWKQQIPISWRMENKLWYIYVIEHYLALDKNKLLILPT